MLFRSVQAIEKKNYSLTEQSKLVGNALLKDAPKLTKQNTRIDFRRTANEVANFVRGLCPYPAAHTELDSPSSGVTLILKVFAVTPELFAHSKKIGTVESDGKSFIRSKGKEGNFYKWENSRFDAIGTSVPEDIDKIINIGPENFSGQRDDPFWFCKTGGDLAKIGRAHV